MNREELIEVAANGNEQALHFLRAYVTRAHMIDDLEDKDKIVTGEQMAQAEAQWLAVLAYNEFFQARKDNLVPVMVLGLNAWLDSNTMQPGIVRDVVKGMWHETVYAVALLTGGYNALRSFTSRLREYDIEPVAGGTTTSQELEVPNGALR